MKDQDVIFQPRKIQRRILLAAVLIVPNIVVWAGLYSAEGIIIQRDFNFPIFNENFENSYFPLWNEDTSQTNIERFPRLIMMSPFLGLSALGVDMSAIVKAMIVSTFALLTISTFAFLSRILRSFSHTAESQNLNILIAVLGAFLFAYNPVNLQFIGGISILVSVGMLPIMLYLVLTKINKKYFPLLLPLPLFLSLGHPFVFIMNIVLTLAFSLVVHYRTLTLGLLFKKFFTTSLIVAVLFAWFWIPYSTMQSTSLDLGREENLERATFERVSENDFYKILLLERDRFIYVGTDPIDLENNFLHFLTLAAVTALAIAILIFSTSNFQRRTSFFLVSGFILTMILTLGNTGYFGEPYWRFVSESDLGWIFRSPLKFQLYQGFFATILAALSLGFVSKKLKIRMNATLSRSILVGVVCVMVIGSGGYGLIDANFNSFNPISLPDEYFEINDIIISQGSDEARVVYYPRYNEITTDWSRGHLIPPFDMKSSRVPTYETSTSYPYVKNAIYDYPYTNGELSFSRFYEYLSSVGVGYVVFHNDRGYEIDQRNLQYLLGMKELTQLYSKNDWYLFQIKLATPEPLRAVSSVAVVENLPDAIKLSTIDMPAIDVTMLGGNAPQYYGISEFYPDSKLSYNGLQNVLADSWSEPTEGFIMSQQSEVQNEEYSLSIASSLPTRNKWSSLVSEELEVIQSQKYLFTAVAKTQNAYASHVKIQGFNGSSGAWADLAFITKGNETSTGLSINANTDWTRYWNTLTIPTDVDKIRYVINAGTVKDPTRGEAVTLLRETGVYNLDGNAASNVQVDYTKISATEYSVDVSSEVPFILVFTESFDKGWVATDGGQEIGSIPLYGMINGFYIDKTGDFTLTLEYKPQRMFALGATISIAAVIGILFYTLKLFSDLVIREYDRTGARTYSAGSLGRAVGIAILTERDQTMTNALGQSNTALDNTRPAEPNLPQPEAGKRLKRRTGNATSPYETSLRKYVMHLPVLVSVGLVLCIPFLVLFEIPHTNLVAGFALDFMVVSVIWMFFLPKLTRKKITLNTPSR